ncbi:hypothetical protein RRG08_050597 [Elysia crispata]|uniref:Uncharacterized protein n=1 Tax=Elysia crispata TaxID=231223 RepID=A0AAE1DB23_9GAST|nr:hypothetical protein RRG08_050597 [Elysia crispata]
MGEKGQRKPIVDRGSRKISPSVHYGLCRNRIPYPHPETSKGCDRRKFGAVALQLLSLSNRQQQQTIIATSILTSGALSPQSCSHSELFPFEYRFCSSLQLGDSRLCLRTFRVKRPANKSEPPKTHPCKCRVGPGPHCHQHGSPSPPVFTHLLSKVLDLELDVGFIRLLLCTYQISCDDKQLLTNSDNTIES